MKKLKTNTQMKSNKIIQTLIAFLLVFPALSWAGQYRIIQVYDGDTIQVDKMGKKSTVRLAGIDAPENKQPFSKDAHKYLEDLCLNHTADIKSYGIDRYGRTLGTVILFDTTDAGLEMIKAGLAEVYRERSPAGVDLRPYMEAETEARKKGLGMWSLGEKYISPRDWKRNIWD